MLVIQCSALVLWSTLIGLPWLGILCAVILVALEKNRGERIITDAQLQSLSDFSFVFLLVVLIVINNEVDRPMEAFILTLRWSPLLFSPWMICRFFGRSQPVTLGTLFVPLRYRALGLAFLGRKTLDLAWPTSLLCLLAASTCEGTMKEWYYLCVALWGSMVLLKSVRSSYSLIIRLLLVLLSVALGYGIHRGIQRTESYLAQRSVEWLNRNLNNSNLMLQTTMLGQTASLQLSEEICLRLNSTQNLRTPFYLKKAHFDQWLGNDTWFCTDPVVSIQPNEQGWVGRMKEVGLSQAEQPHGTMWIAGEGAQSLPMLNHTHALRSTGLSNHKRVGQGMIKAHSDREWVKVEILTGSPHKDDTLPYEGRDLNVSESDAILLRNWLNLTPALQPENLKDAVQLLRKKFITFSYSLSITKPARGTSPLKHFLLDTQTGHCEYFATTVTLLLRTMGIPSRYCSGFLVDEQQGQWTVARGQDAHAWCEAWDGEVWVIVDLTPNGTMPTSWFRGIKDRWGQWMFSFNDWRFGGSEDQLLKWAPYLLGLVLLYFAIRLWSEWRQNRHRITKRDKVKFDRPDPGFAKFEKLMKKNGLERYPHESYGQWAKRLEQEGHRHPINNELIDGWNLWGWSTPSRDEIEKLEGLLSEIKQNVKRLP